MFYRQIQTSRHIAWFVTSKLLNLHQKCVIFVRETNKRAIELVHGGMVTILVYMWGTNRAQANPDSFSDLVMTICLTALKMAFIWVVSVAQVKCGSEQCKH